MSHDEIGIAFLRHKMRLARFDEVFEEMMREFFEERAAIREFDGGLPKEKAEALARAEVETIRRALKEGKE